MNYAKVDGHPNLIRDLRTNAIINTDTVELANYDNTLSIIEKREGKLKDIENQVDELKSSIEEIKTLLRRALDGPR